MTREATTDSRRLIVMHSSVHSVRIETRTISDKASIAEGFVLLTIKSILSDHQPEPVKGISIFTGFGDVSHRDATCPRRTNNHNDTKV